VAACAAVAFVFTLRPLDHLLGDAACRCVALEGGSVVLLRVPALHLVMMLGGSLGAPSLTILGHRQTLLPIRKRHKVRVARLLGTEQTRASRVARFSAHYLARSSIFAFFLSELALIRRLKQACVLLVDLLVLLLPLKIYFCETLLEVLQVVLLPCRALIAIVQ